MPQDMIHFGEYEAVSVSTHGVNSDTRSLTCMERPGGEGDPYGGWKQDDLLTGVDRVVLPDGSSPAPDEKPALGYEDDRRYSVDIGGDGTAVIEVAG